MAGWGSIEPRPVLVLSYPNTQFALSNIDVLANSHAEDSLFLTRGAAADIWLMKTTAANGDPLKYVSKILRVGPESFQDRQRNQLYDNELPIDIGSKQKEFVRDFQLKVIQWSTVRHKNIIDVFGLGENMDLHVEFCGNGTARQYLNLYNQDSQKRGAMIFEVLKGMEYLHTMTCPIIHGSLNLDKIFVSDTGTAKIGEFGLSALTRKFALLAPSISHAGLSRWMSPELLDFNPEDRIPTPTTASDVWSLGCTLFEIIAGEIPYSKHKHELRVRKEIIQGKHPGYPSPDASDEFSYIWPILNSCWATSAVLRPSASTIRQVVYLAIMARYDPSSRILQHSVPKFAAPATRAWDLYVSDKSRGLVETTPGISLKELLGSLYADWASEDPEVKTTYGAMAQRISTTKFPRRRLVRITPYNRDNAKSKNQKPPRTCLKCRFDSPDVMACRRCLASRKECINPSALGDIIQRLASPPENFITQIPPRGWPSSNEAPSWVAQTGFMWDSTWHPRSSMNDGGTPVDQQSVLGGSDTWAVSTAIGKRQRTNEDEKAKSGACKHCKRLKMKCTFDPPSAATCQRCRQGGRDCVVEGRKPRNNSEPLEQLAARIEDKDDIISGLLKIISRPQVEDDETVDSAEIRRWIERGARSLMASSTEILGGGSDQEQLSNESVPFGLLAELSLDDTGQKDRSTGAVHKGEVESGQGRPMSGKSQMGDEDEVGVANMNHFRPSPMAHPELRRIVVERRMVPEILTLKVVTDEEAEHLFRIFHERIDAAIAIVDPVIHTVAVVKARCPLLFTVICAVASRHWIERPELYTALMHYARAAAATAISDGWKSLEVCQAYLLLSIYPQPARRWAEDRAWLFLGCAIRLAMDLNLYKQKSETFVNEAHEREVLNRTRTWDRVSATSLGRPTSIPEDYIARHSREWWRRSKYNSRLDVYLCFDTQLLCAVTRYFSRIYSDPESLTGFNENMEFGPIIRAFDDEMEQFKQDAEHSSPTAPESRHPTCLYRLALLPLAVAYSRLVMYSLGLEHAHRSAVEPGNRFFVRSIDMASEVLRITNEELPNHEFHRYSPDGHWMWSVFAAAFLIKLAQPRTTQPPQPPHLTMTPAQRESSLALVQKFILTLELSAVDIRHTPALYARYLKRILGEPGTVTLSPKNSAAELGSPGNKGSGLVQPGLMAQSGGANLRIAFSPGPSDAEQEEDLLAPMSLCEGSFWSNHLMPGMWDMTAIRTEVKV